MAPPSEPSRNVPCPCGSGKKYKRCCLGKSSSLGGLESRPVLPVAPTREGFGQLLDALGRAEALYQEGKALVDRWEIAAARRKFEEAIRLSPEMIPAHNNLALCEYMEGNVEAAVNIEERVLSDLDPENLFAMGSLVHYLMVVGREPEAVAFADRLQILRPRTDSDIEKMIEASARLRRHEVVARLAGSHAFLLGPMGHYLAGIACVNTGDRDRAVGHLEKAKAASPRMRARMSHLIERIRSGEGPGTLDGEWRYFESPDWMPDEVLKRVIDDMRQGGEEERKAAAARWPFLADVALLEIERTGGKAVSWVQILGWLGTPRAVEILKQIATGSFGPDSLRQAAFMELHERGHLPAGERMAVLHEGERKDLMYLSVEITPEVGHPPPAGLEDLYVRAHEAAKKKRWKESERINREMIEKAPDFPTARHNLAISLLEQDREEEAVKVLGTIAKEDPSYLFAPSTLSNLLVEDGELEAASRILRAVRVPARVHPDAYGYYLNALIRFEIHNGGLEKAGRAMKLAKQLVPGSPYLKPVQRLLKAALGRKGAPIGIWRLVEMEGTASKELESEKDLSIRFGPSGEGDFHFGIAEGGFFYRMKQGADNRVDFTWVGMEQGRNCTGKGSARAEQDGLLMGSFSAGRKKARVFYAKKILCP